ncbi:MAG: extracellular solute-binding protein [Anaerolineae bacterium]|nr:extracellular solute-binding protein [Anaerolineae bacterium]
MSEQKKLSRRDFLNATAFVAAGGLLAACGAAPEIIEKEVEKVVTATPGPTTQAPPPAIAQIRSSIWGDVNDKQIWDGIASDFNAAQDKIKLITEQYIEQEGSGSYYDKIKIGIASGTAPDIFYMQGFIWGPYADNKLVRPIDDLIARDDFNAPYPDIDNYNDNSKWKGETYLTPVNTGSVIMYYNKDVFDLFGVPYPEEGWTYEDFQEKVIAMSSEKDGVPYYGFANAGGWSGIYARALHWMRKDGVLEWDTIVEPKTAQLVQDEIIDALQWTIVDATKNGWTPAPAALAGGGLTIASGQVAMTYEGPWYLPNMSGAGAEKEGGVNFDVIHMPFGKSGKDETVAEIAGFMINAATEYVDEAWEWIKFNTTDEAQTHVAKGGRMCHLPETIDKIWAPLAQEEYNFSNAKWFANSMATGRNPIISGEGSDLFAMMLTGTPLGFAWDSMISGQVSAREAIEKANPECQAILDAYWKG